MMIPTPGNQQQKTIETPTTPIETVEEQPEGMEKIKADIALLKKEHELLQIKQADFEKNKTNLPKEETEKIKKEIIDEQTRIEGKKREILETIKQTKQELASLKGTVETGSTTTDLDTLEKEVQAITVEKPSRFGKARETTKNFVSDHKQGLMIGGAVIGGWMLIRSLFKRNKRESSSEEKKEKKMSRRKKPLLWAGGIFGGIMVWKNRDKISNWLGLGKTKDPEKPETYDDYESLPEEVKVKYRSLSSDIDTATDDKFEPVFSDDSKSDLEKKSAIIFGLDRESKNLKDFASDDTLDYIEDETTDGIVDKIGNWGKTKIHNIVGPFLSTVASFKTFAPKFLTSPVEALNERLKGGTPGEREKQLSSFYKEYINIINYVIEKKRVLKERLAKEKIMGKAHINEATTAAQESAIQEQIENDERNDLVMEKFFKDHKLADIPGLCKEYGIDPSMISKETKEFQDDLEDDKNDILQKEDDGTTAITRAETDFLDGTLDEESKKELIEVCDDLLDDGFGKEEGMGFFGAYTHLITDIFKGNEAVGKSYMTMTHTTEQIAEIKATLTGYIQRLKSGTFSKQDLTDLKEQSDAFFKMKNKYEESIRNTDDMSHGMQFNTMKLLGLPYYAMLDIGKAFGHGKTNSWRERIGCGLGGMYFSGQTLYLLSKVGSHKSIPGAILKPIAGLVGRAGIEIGKLPITLAYKGVQLLTGRSYMTSMGRTRYLKNASHLTAIEKETLLKYAFLDGQVSESGLLRSMERLNISENGNLKTNLDGVLERWGLKEGNQRELFKKYGKNKNIRGLLVTEQPNTALKFWEKAKYTFRDSKLKLEMSFNADNFAKLQKIEENIQKVGTGTKERMFWEMFMENTKTLDKVDDFMKNKRLMGVLTEIGNTSDDYAKLSKILGKNFHKLVIGDDLEKYLLFLKNNKSSIKNTNTFVSNSIKRRSKIKNMDATQQAKYIEEGKLNSSFLSRKIDWMKNKFKTSAEMLRKLKGKTPYGSQVESAAQGLEDLAKVEDGIYESAQVMPEVGKGERLMKMSKNKELMNEISPLFKDEKFLKIISKEKDPSMIRKLLGEKLGKELPKDIVPDEFVNTLAKTKSTRKITDVIKYVQKYEGLNKVMKILENPTMKYASRVLGRTLGIGTVILGGVFAYQTYQEGEEIKKTNKERGELKQDESAVDIALTLAGACAFIPGVGWIAGATILGVTAIGSYVKESVFDTLDKYTKNYKDFLQSTPLLIKEHILSTTLGQAKQDTANGEYLARFFSAKNFEHLTKKTGSEAMKSLLYIEEWNHNQLAMYNINDPEQMASLEKLNPPRTRSDVAQAVDEVEKRVNTRYAFLKSKLGIYSNGKVTERLWLTIPGTVSSLPTKIAYTDKTEYLNLQKVLTPEVIQKGQGMKTLNNLLIESGYVADNPERFPSVQAIEQQKQILRKELSADTDSLHKLNVLITKDKKSLLYMYRYLDAYRQHLESFGAQENKKEEIIKHMEYLNTYMTYLGLTTGLNIPLASGGLAEVNFIKTRNFFVDFSDPGMTHAELYGTSPKIQTALYRIATEVIGIDIKNSQEEILHTFREENEKSYGLYFDDNDFKQLNINGNYTTDNEYDASNPSTLKAIRADIAEQVKDGDLIDVGTGDNTFNKEIGGKYLKIIDEELARK